MNKGVMYGLVGVIVLGVIGYAVFNKQANDRVVSTDGTATTTQSTSKQSLKALLSATTPQKCTFTEAVENSTSNGTVYIAGGKMRGDFTSVAYGKTIVSHMVMVDSTSYMWTDEGQGFKMAFDASQSTSASGQQGMDVNKELEYQCMPWTVDASVFVLPSTITFKDMSALVPGASAGAKGSVTAPSAGSYGGYDMSAQCGACESYPEPQKTQCRTALKCK